MPGGFDGCDGALVQGRALAKASRSDGCSAVIVSRSVNTEGGDVRVGEILDVDVVADAGAVGGVVIVTKNLRVLPAFEGVEHDRHEVHDETVSELWGTGAGYVEVAQGDGAHAVSALGVGKHPFAHVLGRAVGVDGSALEFLIDEVNIGRAVHGRGGAKNEVADACTRRCFEHVGEAADVVVPVHFGLFDGFAHLLVGSEMDHGLHTALAHLALENLNGAVGGDVLLNERSIADAVAKASREIIDNGDGLAALEKKLHNVCANVTCTTNNQSCHGLSLNAPPSGTSPESPRKSHAATMK